MSKLSLSKLKSRMETTADTDAIIECSVLTTTTDTSRLTITWMIGSQMLLTMDLDAVVKFGPAAGLEMDQRIRMKVRQKQTFQLTVHQVRTSDSGQYRCEVDEWLQDPLGDWYSLEKKSVSTELVVKEKGNKTHICFIAMVFSLNCNILHMKKFFMIMVQGPEEKKKENFTWHPWLTNCPP